MTTKDFSKRLNKMLIVFIICQAVCIGLSIFDLSVKNKLQYSMTDESCSSNSFLLVIAPLAVYMSSFFYYRITIRSIKNETVFSIKMKKYFHLLIRKYFLFGGAGILAVVIFMSSAVNFFLIYPIISIISLVSERVTKEKIINALELSYQEISLLEKPDAFLFEIEYNN